MPASFPRRASGRRLLTLTAGLATAAALALTAAPSASAADRTAYPGSKPTWAKAANDAGAAPADETVEGEVVFDLKDRAGAEAVAKAVSTPGSSRYGRYLPPATWIARYAPAKADFTPVLQHLKQNGLTITGVPASRLFITFRGTPGQVNALFGADLRLYRFHGHRVVAPSKAPTLQTGLASAVSGIILDQSRLLTRPAAVASPAATEPVSGIAPCSRWWGERTATLPEAYGRTVFNTANCGYTGPQLRSAYEVPRSLTGAGQTVAIIDAYGSPSVVRDVNTYAGKHGIAPLTRSTYSEIVPRTFYDAEACTGPSGWQGEQMLDVLAVHGVAPKAKVQYVGGFNCGTGLDVAMSQVLDRRLATVVSNSYGNLGEPPADAVVVNENQHLQAAAEGVGLYFSSGDSGDESPNLGRTAPDYPASSPWVTAVGGTTTAIAKDGSVALETGWGNHYDAVVKDPATGTLSYADPVPGAFSSGAGGGVSGLFGLPWYQEGTVSATGRSVPDVAADADPRTGELVGYRPITNDATLKQGPYDEVIYGGTSLASPLLAAEVALVQQSTHATIGFANPLIYGVHAADPSLFRDVLPRFVAVAYDDQTTGETSLVTGNQDTSLTVTPGYDTVTGLGSLSLTQLKGVWSHRR